MYVVLVLLVLYLLYKGISLFVYHLCLSAQSPVKWCWLVWGVVLGAGLWAHFRFQEMNPAQLVTVCVAASVILIPSLFRRLVSEPLGWVKISYYLGRLSLFAFRQEPAGGSHFSAMNAWRNQRKPSEADRLWLMGKINRKSHIGAATIVAAVFVSEQYPDKDRVRKQLLALRFSCISGIPAEVLRFVLNWLALDSAERGEWSNIDALKKWDKTLIWPVGSYLQFVADIVSGKRRKPGRFLQFYYFLLGLNLNLFPLYRLLLDYKSPESPQASGNESKPIEATVGNLVSVYAQTAADSALRSSVSHIEWLIEFTKQTMHTGAQEAAIRPDVLDAIRASCMDSINEWGAESGVSFSAKLQDSVLGGNGPDASDELMETFEALVESFESRKYKPQPVSVDWLEFTEMVYVFQQMKSGNQDCAGAIIDAVSPCWHQAAELWNNRLERFLAHMMFRWLHEQSKGFVDPDQVQKLSAITRIPIYSKYKYRRVLLGLYHFRQGLSFGAQNKA